jgi:hypothetical protein
METGEGNQRWYGYAENMNRVEEEGHRMEN